MPKQKRMIHKLCCFKSKADWGFLFPFLSVCKFKIITYISIPLAFIIDFSFSIALKED